MFYGFHDGNALSLRNRCRNKNGHPKRVTILLKISRTGSPVGRRATSAFSCSYHCVRLLFPAHALFVAFFAMSCSNPPLQGQHSTFCPGAGNYIVFFKSITVSRACHVGGLRGGSFHVSLYPLHCFVHISSQQVRLYDQLFAVFFSVPGQDIYGPRPDGHCHFDIMRMITNNH
jgi:hypothetical protein